MVARISVKKSKMPNQAGGSQDLNQNLSQNLSKNVSQNVNNVNSQEALKSFISKNGYHSLLRKTLQSRGYTSEEDLRGLENASIDQLWANNPYDIDGMEAVVNKIENAVKSGKHVVIYGDYDLDGISATTVMLKGLTKLNNHLSSNALIDSFIPSRLNEGYGITDESIARLLAIKKNIDLIVTVDCGISCEKEIAYLNSKGIDVCVTDHHEASKNVPQSVPWVDPKIAGAEKNVVLAGVGVALKVIQALFSRNGMPNEWREYTDLATLGTIADMMPLLGQNRALVKEGLRRINSRPRVGIKAVLDSQNKNASAESPLCAKDLSFSVIPSLNSAGRMDHPEVALNLLMSEDYSECYNLAAELYKINQQRKTATDRVVEEARSKVKIIKSSNPQIRSLCVADKGWHEGVVGIAAAKIADEFKLPTILFVEKDGVAHGSGRSVGEVNLHAAISSQADLLERFGGHKSAAGLSLRMENMEAFAEGVDNYLQQLDIAEFMQATQVDAKVGLNEVTVESVKELELLEPCGKENDYPSFLAQNVFISHVKAVGADNNHLSCQISDGAYGAQAIQFFCTNIDKILATDEAFCVAFEPRVDTWFGRQSVKLHILDIQPASEFFEQSFNDNDTDYKQLENIYENAGLYENASLQENTVSNVVTGDLNSYNKGFVKKNSEKMETLFELLDCDVNKTKEARYYWQQIAKDNPQNIQQEIVKAMIGQDGKLHDSQQQTLDALQEGKSVLTVMPTGRGKSLIFQVYAAVLALSQNKMSIFVYPLRALIADQAYHLNRAFGKFGLVCEVLTGETSTKTREETYARIQRGQIDIILTTPEYLEIHKQDFAKNGKFGFLVVDECHHIAQTKVGQRVAYEGLGDIAEILNSPQVLALSATINNPAATEIKRILPVQAVITDNFRRENLYVDDKRNIKCRDDYLTSIVASGQKTIIYVNSREQTVALARMLRSRANHVALGVGFYNAGMSREQRKLIEGMFRDGKLCTLVATSAFGEGVNIPDVRHVVLYHLPFSDTEFNQMSGRAGRDGAPAVIHLLYNRADASINTKILNLTNPSRAVLGNVYRWFRALCNVSPDKTYKMVHENLFSLYENKACPEPPGTVLCGLSVFDELGLINVKKQFKDGQTTSIIALVNTNQKVELESSSRFVEGLNELNSFDEYRLKAMRQSAQNLQETFRHPILPE